jgi:hypothetical protein
MTVVIELDGGQSIREYPMLRAPFSPHKSTLYVTMSEKVENISETTPGDVVIGYTDGDNDTIPDASIVRVS